MKSQISNILTRYPLVSVILLILVGITIIPEIIGMLGISLGVTGGMIYRFVVGGAAIWLLVWLGWGVQAGVTNPFGNWHKWWPILSIPFLLLVFVNLMEVDFSALTVTPGRVAKLVLENLAVGVYEEALLRGLALYVLFRAWGQTRFGLYMAVIAQAVIFGLLHYYNLGTGASFGAVSVQVIFAILVGIGFGGLALLVRSIWPGVIIHGLIDAASSIEQTLGTDALTDVTASVDETAFSDALVGIVVLFFVCTVTGLLYARRARLHD